MVLQWCCVQPGVEGSCVKLSLGRTSRKSPSPCGVCEQRERQEDRRQELQQKQRQVLHTPIFSRTASASPRKSAAGVGCLLADAGPHAASASPWISSGQSSARLFPSAAQAAMKTFESGHMQPSICNSLADADSQRCRCTTQLKLELQCLKNRFGSGNSRGICGAAGLQRQESAALDLVRLSAN